MADPAVDANLSGPSEIASSRKTLCGLRACELVDRDPLPSGRVERADRSMRDPEHRLGAPAALLQVRHRALEALHPVDQHGAVSSQVPGQQDVWWLVAQLHHRDARAE